jgi:hypothetical protein
MQYNMKLIANDYNRGQDDEIRTWLADNATEISANFDAESASGSMIIVIETKDIYIKNSEGKWQKFGTNEVI